MNLKFFALLLGLAATLAVPMLVLLRRLDKASAATVATAALVCAYLGAQALFQPALPRYTEAAQFGIVAFVSLVFHHLKEGLLSSKPPAMSGQDRLAGL